jgi:hypothetical protein
MPHMHMMIIHSPKATRACTRTSPPPQVLFKSGGIGTLYPLYYALVQRAKRADAAAKQQAPGVAQEEITKMAHTAFVGGRSGGLGARLRVCDGRSPKALSDCASALPKQATLCSASGASCSGVSKMWRCRVKRALNRPVLCCPPQTPTTRRRCTSPSLSAMNSGSRSSPSEDRGGAGLTAGCIRAWGGEGASSAQSAGCFVL